MIYELYLCFVLVAKSYPRDFSPWGSCALELARILQSRILEWVAIPFSRGSSWLRDQTWVSHITGRFFNIWAIKQIPELYLKLFLKKKDDILIAIISGWWDLTKNDLLGWLKSFFGFQVKNKKHIFHFPQNFTEQHIYCFILLPSAIFQATT